MWFLLNHVTLYWLAENDKIGWFDTGQNQDFPHHGDVLPKSYILVKISLLKYRKYIVLKSLT